MEVGHFSLDSRFKITLVVYISWAIFWLFLGFHLLRKCARDYFFQRLMTKRRMRGICCSKVQFLKNASATWK